MIEYALLVALIAIVVAAGSGNAGDDDQDEVFVGERLRRHATTAAAHEVERGLAQCAASAPADLRRSGGVAAVVPRICTGRQCRDDGGVRPADRADRDGRCPDAVEHWNCSENEVFIRVVVSGGQFDLLVLRSRG